MPVDPDDPDIDAAFAAWEEEALLLAAAATNEVVREAWDRAFDEIGLARPGRFDPEAQAFMRDFHFTAIRRIGREEREVIRRQLLQAVMDGLGTDAAARVLGEEFDARRARLRLIARTELNRAANWGRFAGWRASGLVTHKEFIATDDDRVRPDHLAADGEIVPLDAAFTRGAADGRVAPPLAPNCRCTFAPVVEDEARASGLFAAKDDRPAFVEVFPFIRRATNQYERDLVASWRDLRARIREVVRR